MADISNDVRSWSSTEAGNPPAGTTNVGPGLDNNLQAIQAAVRKQLEDAQWFDFGHTPTFINATQFSIAGTDVTAIYEPGRRLKITDSSTLYGQVTTATFGGGNTTVTVALGGSLSASLSRVKLSIITNNNNALPVRPSEIPVGTVINYASSTAPSGWLVCNGQAVSRVTFSALFSLLGTSYGAGDGVNTFNLPNLSGRVILGSGQGFALTNRTLGQFGGTEAEVLFLAHMPVHAHGGVTGGGGAHGHFISSHTSATAVAGPPPDSRYLVVDGTGGSGAAGGVFATGDHLHGVAAEGGNVAHNNMPPFIVLTKLIKT